MTDLLAKLYNLPPLDPLLERLNHEGVNVRRAMAYEKHETVDWVRENFGKGWAAECDVAFANQPISCFIATTEGKILGFACHDSTCRNFFGPTGVLPTERGRGVGKALLLACLHGMRALGFAYAIIGGVGPIEFYQKVAGTIEIPDSTPGIYRDMIHG